VARLPQIETE